MTLTILSALAGLLATLGVAFWLLRGGRDRAGFACVVSAPLVAGLAFVLAGSVSRPASADAAAASPSSDAAAPSPPATAPEPASEAPAPAAAGGGGGVIDGLRRDAEEMRRTKRFAEARAAYEKITQMAPFDADAWADLGDAAAAAAGGDLKAGIRSIDRALEIDPKHAKALWLKASLELQDKHYSKAADLWQRLLDQLPKDSNDARIVSANLEETRSLAAKQGAGR